MRAQAVRVSFGCDALCMPLLLSLLLSKELLVRAVGAIGTCLYSVMRRRGAWNPLPTRQWSRLLHLHRMKARPRCGVRNDRCRAPAPVPQG